MIQAQQRFGRLTVIDPRTHTYDAAKQVHPYAWMRCDCGIEKEIRRENLTRGLTISCGCSRKAGQRSKVNVGMQFGRLTVLQVHVSGSSKDHGLPFAQVRCACGIEKRVLRENLTRGLTKSCGCLGKENRQTSLTKHGLTYRPEYAIWEAMKSRCSNPKCARYSRYGGRGIRFCKRWRSFASFYADMGPRPSAAHSIDRIDNDGDYTPENCRWATDKVQRRTKRDTALFELHGRHQTLFDWSEEYGACYSLVWARVKRRGWKLSKALTIPNQRSA